MAIQCVVMPTEPFQCDVDPRDLPMNSLLASLSPVERLQLVHHLEPISDEELRKIRDFVGRESFEKFGRQLRTLAGRFYAIAGEPQ